MDKDLIENRSAPRSLVDQYYSIEFSLECLEYTYQFKIWNISSKGLCVVVKEDSEILKHLKVGDVLKIKYYQTNASQPAEFLTTEIRHITPDEEGRFKGHYLVGFLILDGHHPS